MASIRPFGRINGMLHFVNLSNAATARDTAASLPPNWSCTQDSSARPRTISTATPRSVTRYRQWHARQPGSATDIHDPVTAFEELTDHGAVQ